MQLMRTKYERMGLDGMSITFGKPKRQQDSRYRTMSSHTLTLSEATRNKMAQIREGSTDNNLQAQ